MPSIGQNIDARQYEALFNNAIVGIVLTNQAGEIVHVNRFAESLFGYSRNELAGMPVEILIPGKFRGHHKSYRQGFYRHPETRTMGEGRDLYALRKDGSEFPAEVSLSHYELEGQVFVIVFVVDITVRKSAELEIKQLNQELEQKVTDRTMLLHEALLALEQSREELNTAFEKEKELGALKSRFVSMASHEFRTPLSTILSSVSLARRYGAPQDLDNRERHLGKIQAAVKVLNDILEDFLSLGKLEEGLVAVKPEPLGRQDLLDELGELVQEMGKASVKGQALNVSHTLPDTDFVVDRKLLRNILVNLLSNAIKYSPERSVIDVYCSYGPGELEISVRDQGIGIAEEEQRHLFERFFRAGNASGIQGTGLGLHIVGRYVSLMGGRVTLTSKLNEGTTITVYIPQA